MCRMHVIYIKNQKYSKYSEKYKYIQNIQRIVYIMVFEEYGTLCKLHFFNRIHKNFILHKLQYSYERFKFIL